MDSNIRLVLPLLLVGACAGRSPGGDGDAETGDDATDTGSCEESLGFQFEARGPLAITSMWADEDEIVAAGTQQLVLFDGSDWTVEPVEDLELMSDVWATSGDDVYLASERGIAHWDGESLVLEHAKPPAVMGDWIEEFVAIWGASPEEIWAVGLTEQYVIDCYYDCPFRSLGRQGPGDWLDISPDSKVTLSSVHAAQGRTIAGGGNEVWAREGDQWIAWAPAPLDVAHVWTADGETAWVAQVLGLQVASGGPGAWQTFDLSGYQLGVDTRLVGLWGRENDDVYAALSDEESTRILHFDGAAWQTYASVDATMHPPHYDVTLARGRRLITTPDAILVAAAGDGAEVWRVDGGTSTRLFAAGGVGAQSDLYGLPDGSVLGLGVRGLSLRQEGTWSTIAARPENEAWFQVAGRSAADVYVSGYQVPLSHWDGNQFEPIDVSLPGLDEVEDLWVGEGVLWMVASVIDGDTFSMVALRRVDEAWETHPLGEQGHSPRITGSGTDLWIAADSKLWHWEGDAFVDVDLGDASVHDAYSDGEGSLWMILDDGAGHLVDGELETFELPKAYWRSIAAADGDVWLLGIAEGEGTPLTAAHFDGATWHDAALGQLAIPGELVPVSDGAVFSDDYSPVRLHAVCE